MFSHRLIATLIIVVLFFTVGCASSAIDNAPASPSPTATAHPAPSHGTLTATVTAPPTLTALPSPTPQPTSTCKAMPEGVFLTIWEGNPDFQAALGCPISAHPRIEPAAWEVETAYQPFEHGAMIWSNKIGWYALPVIYILYSDGTFQRFEDTFDRAMDPVEGEEAPPQEHCEPILGFGKVWREQPGVRKALGWATVEETPGAGRFQTFVGGAMVWLSQRGETYVFFDNHYAVVDSPVFLLTTSSRR